MAVHDVAGIKLVDLNNAVDMTLVAADTRFAGQEVEGTYEVSCRLAQ